MVQLGDKRGSYMKTKISKEAKELRKLALELCEIFPEENLSIEQAVNIILRYKGKKFQKEYSDVEIGYVLGIRTQQVKLYANSAYRKLKR